MLRAGLVLVGLSVGVLAAKALGSPSGESTGPSIRSEQAKGAEAIIDLLELRERGLDRREATLQARVDDLKAAETQVAAQLAQLEALREQIKSQLAGLDDQRQARVTKLVKMIESVSESG